MPTLVIRCYLQSAIYLSVSYALLHCYFDNRDDEDEDMEEMIQKRRGRRKKRKKAGKVVKKEKEVIEEGKPPEEDYEQTGLGIYIVLTIL